MSVTAKGPLAWPEGWQRTAHHRRGNGRFSTTYAKTMTRLQKEMRLLKASNIVVSSNLPLRQDGLPRSDVARYRIEDPGVAVYFMLRGRQMVMARDAYESVYDNLHSLVLAVEHLRGMERHGGGAMLERAFEGFSAIAAPGAQKGWREILGFIPGSKPTYDELRENFRQKMKTAHPDMAGGSHDAVIAINDAMAAARKELGL